MTHLKLQNTSKNLQNSPNFGQKQAKMLKSTFWCDKLWISGKPSKKRQKRLKIFNLGLTGISDFWFRILHNTHQFDPSVSKYLSIGDISETLLTRSSCMRVISMFQHQRHSNESGRWRNYSVSQLGKLLLAYAINSSILSAALIKGAVKQCFRAF